MISGDLALRLRLTVVTDGALAAPRTVIEVSRAALAGGATCIQLRNKGDGTRELLALGKELRALTRAHNALLIVNDRLDIALAVEADGVHLGPHDLPVSAARTCGPPELIIGRSADTVPVALEAARDGADYIGCGTVYPTTTKPDAGDTIGVERLAAVVAASAVPVVGIGGITAVNAHAVIGAGACGVAVVGAVMAAQRPDKAVAGLLQAMARV